MLLQVLLVKKLKSNEVVHIDHEVRYIMKIGNRKIGKGEPVYIIAELSANHNGSLERALEIIRAAADSGADAVKLQTYTADTLTLKCDNDCFRIGKGTVWEGKTLYELYADAYTPWEWHRVLKKEAETLGMDCFSSPFDFSSVDFLEKLDVPAYKIASFELVDIPLIKYAASKGKPVIMSTGMATDDEIKDAVEAVHSTGNRDLALLKCTSAYPALPEDMNLKTIPDIGERFGVTVGLSDHTLTNDVSIASVALGGSIIEKHITLSRADGGHDAGFSLEPAEFADMVKSVRIVEKALGKVCYSGTEKEKALRQFRRSIFAVEDIKKGELFTNDNIRSIRPGNGLPPKHYEEIIAKFAKCDIKRGTPLSWDMINK
jgi:pseudaminic acid synthase